VVILLIKKHLIISLFIFLLFSFLVYPYSFYFLIFGMSWNYLKHYYEYRLKIALQMIAH